MARKARTVVRSWSALKRDLEKNFRGITLDVNILKEVQKRTKKTISIMDKDLKILVKSDVNNLLKKLQTEKANIEKKVQGIIKKEVANINKLITVERSRELKKLQNTVKKYIKKVTKKKVKKRKPVRKKSRTSGKKKISSS